MATPSNPIIQNQPWANSSTLSFYWSPPINQGSGPVTNYNLFCSSISYSILINSSSFSYTVSSLTNQKDYVFQIAAMNFYGLGPYSAFNTGQPGILSVSTICISANTTTPSTVTVRWSYIANQQEGKVQYFIISAIPSTTSLSTIQMVAYQDQRTYTMHINNPPAYTYLVQAVNCAGWSFPYSYSSVPWSSS